MLTALCPGRRTLIRLWSVIPAERRRRYEAYARWLRESDWPERVIALAGWLYSAVWQWYVLVRA